MTAFTWIISAIALVGVILNIKKNPICFVLWAISNFAWTVIDFQKQIYAQAALQYVYFWLSIYGLVTWTAEERNMSVESPTMEKEASNGESSADCAQ